MFGKLIDQDEILESVKSKLDGGSSHGLTNEEYTDVRNLLKSVTPNDTEKQTIFPDFVSEYGFIEHFHVTSGKMNSKGYETLTARAETQRDHEKFMNDTMENLPKNNNDILFTQHHTTICRQHDSLDKFHNSFEKTWCDHIDSLSKYNGQKHISCFMISSDDVLETMESSVAVNGICYGDLVANDIPHFCLAYDTKLLNFMYQYRDLIDYVIYYNMRWKYAEIIKLKNIPALKTFLEHRRYYIGAVLLWETSSTYGIHIPKKVCDETDNT